MSLHVHAFTRWRIRRLFTSELASGSYRALIGEVAHCASCASLYARYSLLEDALSDPASPSPLALERIEAAVLDRASRVPRAQRVGKWLLASSVAAACAVALCLGVFSLRTDRLPLNSNSRVVPVSVTTRGAPAPRGANVGIRMLRVASSARIDETNTVSIADVVTFTWTDVDPQARYFLLFGAQADGSIHWYYPGDRDMSILVEGERIDEPLGDGFRLSRRHSAGWLRVTGIFSERPFSKVELERAVRAHAGSLKDLAPLSLGDGVLEHSILIDIAGQ